MAKAKDDGFSKSQMTIILSVVVAAALAGFGLVGSFVGYWGVKTDGKVETLDGRVGKLETGLTEVNTKVANLQETGKRVEDKLDKIIDRLGQDPHKK